MPNDSCAGNAGVGEVVGVLAAADARGHRIVVVLGVGPVDAPATSAPAPRFVLPAPGCFGEAIAIAGAAFQFVLVVGGHSPASYEHMFVPVNR